MTQKMRTLGRWSLATLERIRLRLGQDSAHWLTR